MAVGFLLLFKGVVAVMSTAVADVSAVDLFEAAGRRCCLEDFREEEGPCLHVEGRHLLEGEFLFKEGT